MLANAYRAQLASKRREQLLKLIAANDLLPSTFAVPIRVLELHRRGTAGASELADAVSLDPALVTKLLALVNSAAYSPTQRVTRVSQAVAMVGVKNLLPLIFGYSLGGIFNKLGMPSDDRTGVWRASVLKAVTAREVAVVVSPELAEEAFLCGLLQDVALPIICTSDRAAWPEVVTILQAGANELASDREHRMYGADHGELGEQIARVMKLPELFQSAILGHHRGLEELAARLGRPGLARAVDVASTLPHKLGQVVPASLAQALGVRIRTALAGHVDSQPERPALVLTAICEKYAHTLAAFTESHERGPLFRQFLETLGREIALAIQSSVADAHNTISALQARQGEMAQKVASLEDRAARSDYDELTATLNRRGFFSRLARLLPLSREYGHHCAVGFLDLDDFKLVNDRSGHAAGDRALVAVAQRLEELTSGRGLAGRLGGDEFAIVLVAPDAQGLKSHLEELARSMDGIVAELGSAQCRIGVSIGIVEIAVPSQADTPDSVLKRADEIMYKVKQARKLRRAARTPGG